jgi:hypothetical protein
MYYVIFRAYKKKRLFDCRFLRRYPQGMKSTAHPSGRKVLGTAMRDTQQELERVVTQGYLIAPEGAMRFEIVSLFNAYSALCYHRRVPLVYAERAGDSFTIIVDLQPLHSFLTEAGVIRLSQEFTRFSTLHGQLLIGAPEMPLYGHSGILANGVKACVEAIWEILNDPQWLVEDESRWIC